MRKRSLIFSIMFAIMLLATAGVASAALEDNFIAYYQFDNTLGATANLTDYFGRENGTISGTITTKNSEYGGATQTASNVSSGGFMVVPHSSRWDFTDAVTVLVLANFSDNTTAQQAISDYNTSGSARRFGITTSTNPASGWQFTVSWDPATAGNTTNSDPNVYAPDVTTFCLFTWNYTANSGAKAIYCDGSDVTATDLPVSAPMQTTSQDIFIMEYHSLSRPFADGGGVLELAVLPYDIDNTTALAITAEYAAGGDIITYFNSLNAATLYVNGTNGACSDAYTRTQAQDPATPWCGDDTTPYDDATAGDLVLFSPGTYRNTNGYSPSAKDSGAKFQAQDTTPFATNITSQFEAFANGSNSCWTNYANTTGYSLWNMTGGNSCIPGGTGSPLLVEYLDDGFPLMPMGALSNLTAYTTNPEACYSTSSSVFYCRFELGKNPNTLALGVGKAGVINLNNFDNAHWDGFTFRSSTYTFYCLTNCDNLTLSNNTFIGGQSGGTGSGTGTIRIESTATTNGFTFQGNNVSRSYPNWYWSTAKNGLSTEVAATWLDDLGSNVVIRDNSFSGYFNLLLLKADSAGKFSQALIYNNSFSFGSDDCLEMESFANGYNISYNTFNYCYVDISTSAAPSPTATVYMHNNLALNNLQVKEFSGNNSGPTFKNYDSPGMTNYEIYHNTFCDGAILSANSNTGSQINVTWTDNIFCSDIGSRLIDYTGTDTDNNFYDYFLFYTTGTVVRFANDTSGSLSLSGWQTAMPAWNANSLFGNALLRSDGVPADNSPACGAASDGGDIGALACAPPSSPGSIVNINTSYPGTQQYPLNFTIDFNFTNAFNLTANCTLYVNSTAVNFSSDLNADTTYYATSNITNLGIGNYTANFTCIDSAGITNSSATVSFQVTNDAPVISAVSNSTTATTITITWTTDELANSTIEYGINATSLPGTAGSASFTTSHSVTLSGLTEDIAYYYNITSCDEFGLCTTAGTYTATTTEATCTDQEVQTLTLVGIAYIGGLVLFIFGVVGLMQGGANPLLVTLNGVVLVIFAPIIINYAVGACL